MRKTLLLLLVVAALVGSALAGDEYETWITHTSHEDFAAGRIGDGGTNLYITRSGRLEMIYRWDLNNDGYLDVLVIQDHNPLENTDALVYWGKKGGPESILPPLPEQQPLARLLRQIKERDKGVTAPAQRRWRPFISRRSQWRRLSRDRLPATSSITTRST